ncbi:MULTISPECIES: serine/threonine-protein kinase [Limnospira]|jgi:serine/threonine-protein kinase|uniref:non-specific serine/threonine protein kinase n=1 Tax=Limnospira platensis NIES-46 TaxID=1236695 RepID=A0A5M3T9W9_LIMPL|nr:serine/threonine-protein kinase [Arthrospira platensis]MDF2209306.1 serine/threonine-protein kinase [Arthrospira platensis NCB002]MDT9181971.1 serine/threonine-protein kinase [Limnospira sp. PMC 289.06]MDT9294150.1 serine/threonine-protein kinase [Arthrospira platensis PCC 7345]BAI90025.1 serine/threonine protein kinase [Arthrospira platensis NIES-39]BDT12352.1 serine/threonine protein kinase [Arthrospira platensis NIES-39]
MKIHCTRPGCPKPDNLYPDLDDHANLKTVQQKYCTTCGMPLILDGRYLTERLLGQGGFGAAFLARDRRSPSLRTCVVKQFLPAGDLDPQQLAIAQGLFEREAQVLDRLGHQHPQIPNLLAYFPLEATGWQTRTPQQFFYLVQEYIDGQNLEQELSSRGPFSETEVLEVMREILNVLEFVHGEDVIHRDLKPSNIMRDRSGTLHLLDFGAVKEVTQAPGNKSTGIYSAGFAPPEQMRGRSVYPSTDLYALGVTAIMLLTAKDPEDLFDSYSNAWLWKDQVTISDSITNILDRMLQPTPSDRFGAATEVLTALNAMISPPPPPISPPPPPPPVVPAPSVTPQSAPVSAPVATQIQAPTPTVRRPFSILEILASAAFTGFDGGLLVMVLWSLLDTIPLSLGIAGLLLAGLLLAQVRRWIEKWDLLIVAGISFAIVFWVGTTRGNLEVAQVIILPILTALSAVVATSLFRLIYGILKRLIS